MVEAEVSQSELGSGGVQGQVRVKRGPVAFHMNLKKKLKSQFFKSFGHPKYLNLQFSKFSKIVVQFGTSTWIGNTACHPAPLNILPSLIFLCSAERAVSFQSFCPPA